MFLKSLSIWEKERRHQWEKSIPSLSTYMAKFASVEWLRHAPNILCFHFFFSALLVVETETFGSHIRIKGKESEHYICMNEKGKIVGRVSIFRLWELVKPISFLLTRFNRHFPTSNFSNGTLNPGWIERSRKQIRFLPLLLYTPTKPLW